MASAPPEIPGLADWRPLARGGFATVWQARQESLNRQVAVKVDQRRLDADVEQRRFLREAGAAGRLSGHPGIVTVHDAGLLGDDRPFLVMELCPGGSLTKWLTRDPRPSSRQVRDVGVRIADALAAAHARGVLHRDVKPANILIDAYDNPGLADFGLAAFPDPGSDLSYTLEALTPAYAAPELFRYRPPTEYGDVYSLAATLYALLTGGPPRWAGQDQPSVAAVLERQQEPIEPIPGVDEGLMALLLTALADDPDERPTAAQFRDQLAALRLPAEADGSAAAGALSAEGGASEAATGSGVERLRGAADGDAGASVEERPVPRRRPVLVLAAVLVLLVVVVALAVNRLGTPTAGPGPASAVTTGTVPSTAPATDRPSSEGTSPTPAGRTSAPHVPAGYVDCSKRYGGTSFCVTAQECWAGIISVSDLPALGTPQACHKTHVYQTFAAGLLPYDVRRQSQLDSDRQARSLCTARHANAALTGGEQRGDWEILMLPPQGTSGDDNLYRCLVGHGDRGSALRLHEPS